MTVTDDVITLLQDEWDATVTPVPADTIIVNRKISMEDEFHDWHGIAVEESPRIEKVAAPTGTLYKRITPIGIYISAVKDTDTDKSGITIVNAYVNEIITLLANKRLTNAAYYHVIDSSVDDAEHGASGVVKAQKVELIFYT